MSERQLLHHAVRMAAITMVSRITGYLRDKALAWVLGAGMLNDAFRTAFRIPNAFRALLAEGALHAAFVPALARLGDEGEEGERARELVRGLTAALLLALAVVVAGGIVATPLLVRLYAQGFAAEAGKVGVTVLMTRIMFPYLALISLAALCQGVLNSRERFLLPAVTPVLFNITLVAAAWWLSRGAGDASLVLAAAVLAGGALQLGIQLPAVRRLRFSILPLWRAASSPQVRTVLVLMVPGITVLGINQLNQLITSRFASFLGEGAVTAQFYAYRVTELLFGGIVVQLTTVLLPVLSRQLKAEPAAAAGTLADTIRLVTFVTLPTATLLAFAARPMIGLAFGGGRFGAKAVAVTGATLAAYAFGLVGTGHAKVMASAFFAQGNTRTPMWGSALALVLFTIGCAMAVGPLGVPGLGLANTVAMLGYGGALTLLYVRAHPLPWSVVRPLLTAVGRQVAGAAAAAAVLVWSAPLIADVVRTGLDEAVRVAAVVGAAVGVYLVVVAALGGRELWSMLAAVRGRRAA